MTYKFALSKEHLVIISEALASMPYAKVALLIEELRKQMATQKKEVEESK